MNICGPDFTRTDNLLNHPHGQVAVCHRVNTKTHNKEHSSSLTRFINQANMNAFRLGGNWSSCK